jgi:hypothetical protein
VDLLRKYCVRVSEAMARQIHPVLFQRLDRRKRRGSSDFLIPPHGLGSVGICRETTPAKLPLIIKELDLTIMLGRLRNRLGQNPRDQEV